MKRYIYCSSCNSIRRPVCASTRDVNIHVGSSAENASFAISTQILVSDLKMFLRTALKEHGISTIIIRSISEVIDASDSNSFDEGDRLQYTFSISTADGSTGAGLEYEFIDGDWHCLENEEYDRSDWAYEIAEELTMG